MMERILEIFFWTSIAFVLYTYFIYPMILFLFIKAIQLKKHSRRPSYGGELHKTIGKKALPTVSLIIAAYNEEEVIEDKVKNSLALDYPKDQLEIIIASDGSEDRTNAIARAYTSSGIRLIEYGRTGKIGVINRTIPQAKGDIIVLSDANVMYSADAIKKLVRHFDKNPKIGVVCGKLNLYSPDGHNQEDFYWRYEVMLRSMEGKLGCTLGANGAIYAMRKELFEPIPDNTISDDFVIAMRIKEKGYDVILDPEAKAYEKTYEDVQSEFVRRTRVAAAGFQAISLTKRLLDPRRGFVAFAYWSHKVIRWYVPFLLAIAFVSNLFLLNHSHYLILFGSQSLFYLSALIGYLLSRKPNTFKIFSIPYYFTAMNVALLFGLFRFLTKVQKAAWESRVR